MSLKVHCRGHKTSTGFSSHEFISKGMHEKENMNVISCLLWTMSHRHSFVLCKVLVTLNRGKEVTSMFFMKPVILWPRGSQ
jgi:hypothetical protein